EEFSGGVKRPPRTGRGSTAPPAPPGPGGGRVRRRPDQGPVPASGTVSVSSPPAWSVAGGGGAGGGAAAPVRATRQTMLARSSAMTRAPRGSTVTPTGRPRVVPSSSRKPVAKSLGSPAGRPLRNGTNTTL